MSAYRSLVRKNNHCNNAGDCLRQPNAPFTQTHADRHLGNLLGLQAGIPIEVKAQSMGHTQI